MSMTTHAKPPEVIAYDLGDGIHWVTLCAHCRVWHYHGAAPGHRVAHCPDPRSPFKETGYTLTGGTPVPKGWKKMQRRDYRRSWWLRPNN